MLAGWRRLTRLAGDARSKLLLGRHPLAPVPSIEKALSERYRLLSWQWAGIPTALALCLVLLSWSVGPLRDLLPLTPLVTCLLPLSLDRRIALILAVAALTALGCFLRYRAPSDGVLWIAPLTFASASSIWLGHLLYLFLRQSHYQSHEITHLERSFQSRVEARTLELRRLLRRIESTREAERARIARELHDELGQELSALRYELSFIRRRYEKEPGAIANNLDDLEALVRRTAATTRGLVSELRPKVLDDLGLPAAVQWLAERSKARGALEIRCSVSSELSALDVRVASVAFRVLQEALTNVVRHAQARSAEVEALSHEGILELRVTDDGIGLKAAQARENRSGGHVGLIGMRERALSLGGRVEVRERESGGTEVRAWLPLAPPAEDAPAEDALA